MLNGKIGVLFSETSDDPEALAAAVASAIADATGTFVSNKQPAGTHPCFEVSVSTTPEPVGSRCTTHQPRARERMTKVSPLGAGVRQVRGREGERIRTRRRQIRLLVLPYRGKSPPHMKHP